MPYAPAYAGSAQGDLCSCDYCGAREFFHMQVWSVCVCFAFAKRDAFGMGGLLAMGVSVPGRLGAPLGL